MEKKTIAWCIPKKALIKFTDSKESADIAESCTYDFAKAPIKKNDEVEVTIVGDKVTALKKMGSALIKEENTETKEAVAEVAEDETVTKEVYCVSAYGLKFTDNDKVWVNFVDELQKQDLRGMGVVAKNTITVGLCKGKIVAIKEVKRPEASSIKEEEKKTETKNSSSSYRDETSVDKRTATMNAKDVVIALLNNKQIENKDINTVIKELSKTFYDTITNL